MICVKQALRAQDRPEWTCAGVECVWSTVPAGSLRACDARNLHIAVVYIPPDRHSQPSRLCILRDHINRLTDMYPNDNFLIAGDFNLPQISWTELMPSFKKGTNVAYNTAVEGLLDCCSISGLHQYNDITNTCNNILDLILSTVPLEISRSQSPLVSEDVYHPSLEIDASDLIIPHLKEKQTTKYQFYKADYEDINADLISTDWNALLCGDLMDEVIQKYYLKLSHVINKHVPKTTSSTKKFPTWFTRPLIKIIKNKLSAHKRWVLYRNPRDYDEFSILRTRQKKMQKLCYAQYQKHIQLCLKENPKRLWSYLKSLRANNSSYPKTLILNDDIYQNESEACMGFSNFFNSVFQKPASSYSIPFCEASSGCQIISNLIITENSIFEALKSLDINKGPGSDEIPAYFMRKCSGSLAKPLYKLFHLSINVYKVFPEKWKEALIVPIHKSGTRTNIKNYRPISILNVTSKIFEKIVYQSISSHILNQIPEEQHGFMRKRCVVSNLSILTDYIYRSMDEGLQVDVVYTDFEKAFDRVDHDILLHKLFALGIRGDLHRWFCSYITKRRQAVRIGASRSNFTLNDSGVPQGSILGPLLYNAYLYDINTSFDHCKFLMFADDKKLFLKIHDINDCYKIQNDINNLQQYYIRNRININTSKCSQITFTRKTKPIIYEYNINNYTIARVKLVRDLGVFLDAKMTFVDHIDFLVGKAYKQLGFVRRVCDTFVNTECIRALYCCFVRSVLEYASSIWSPCYKMHIERVEVIQEKFVKYLCLKTYEPFDTYIKACKRFKIVPLELRREQYDVLLLRDILCGAVDSSALLSKISLRVPSYRTRHTPLIHVPLVSTTYAQNSVLCRIARNYNCKYSDLDICCLSKAQLRKEIFMKHGGR